VKAHKVTEFAEHRLPKASSALPISVAGSQNKNASAPTHRWRNRFLHDFDFCVLRRIKSA